MTPAIFGLSGLSLTDDERAFFKESDPAGYILFGRNVEGRDQLRSLTDDLRSISGRDDLLISIDQEGGRVARMKPPVWDAYPAGAPFAQLYEIAPASAIEALRANAQLLGQDLAEVGISVDYWPCIDVRQTGAHDVIGDRALGEEPVRIAALARAVLDGLGRAGVVGCVKHMPGHGRAMADSHKELPIVTASAEELELDIAPFKSLCHAPIGQALIGMSAHIRYTAWDGENPATQSPFVIEEIIRGRIGFDGLLLTDDLDMQALSGSVPERAEASIEAGCDIALNCWAKMPDMVGIADRLPSMSAATTERLDNALSGRKSTEDQAERGALLAQRDQLLDLAKANA